MSEKSKQQDITRKRVVYHLPEEDSVTIRRGVEYSARDTGALTMDVYYPPDAKSGDRTPAVIFVSGYSDVGFQRMLGCKLKDMESYISWGRLTAASGLVAITYTNVEPEADVKALLEHISQNAESLGVDENRIGIWACSGNVPNALSLLMQHERHYLKCAVLPYAMMLDVDGHTRTEESAKMIGFVNPCAGKSVEDLPDKMPLFIVRAGQDQTPHLNETLDRFLAKAVECNLPITFINHPTAQHGFDVLDDDATTREVVRQILAFMQLHLLSYNGY